MALRPPTAVVEVSHGKPRVRAERADRPRASLPELAAPVRDPHTGRFTSGNPGGRLRQLAALGKAEAASLLRLPVDAVAPWLRSSLSEAQQLVQELIDALPAQKADLVALCADEARARMMASAALSEGAREDCPPDVARAWREEARAWMRESRQVALTRKALARDVQPTATDDDAPWLQRGGK